MRRNIAVTTILFFVITADQSSLGTVVYDSLPFTDGADGSNVGYEVGQSVQLSGDARQITKAEVAIGDSDGGRFQIRFYELDGTGGIPGSMIWESPIQTFPWDPPFYNQKIISVDVPAVVVPSKFAWVVAGAAPIGVAVLSSFPPTVGQSFELWERDPGKAWRVFRLNTNVFGMRLSAVPEPKASAVIVWAFLALGTQRSRRSLAGSNSSGAE